MGSMPAGRNTGGREAKLRTRERVEIARKEGRLWLRWEISRVIRVTCTDDNNYRKSRCAWEAGWNDQQGGVWERCTQGARYSQEESNRWRRLWWKVPIAEHME
jgi:hypothetical protein